MDRESRKHYHWVYFTSVCIAIVGIILGDYRTIPEGMKAIFYSKAILITDYIALAGVAAAFFNVALVTLFSAILMRLNHLPMHGRSILTVGLMAGFGFFGKNIYTMWFILLGTYLLGVICKEKFSKNLMSGLLATSLGPIVGVAYLHNGVTPLSVFYAVIVGIIIGFVIPLLAIHTNVILRGLNLYNVGFAVGLLAMIMVPVMHSLNFSFDNQGCWSTGNNMQFGIFLYMLSLVFILCGYLADRDNAFKNYITLLKRPGLGKDDFTYLDGIGAVLVNMGVNTIICTTYLLLIKGDLNGPTLGGIFTIIGFSANGKHAKNIIPVMLGIFIGGLISPTYSPTTPGIQMAVLFGTTLAPVAGTYGFVAGTFAAIIHSSAVLKSGISAGGANLYNNGFCGGVISIVLYPVLSRFLKANTFNEPSESRCKPHDIEVVAVAAEV
ncbi:MAG: DUF1576 domain-containing protein [Lachnospiraceae bacterium]|nr:DUF1576 domain-containing protein [Lachnospiraceae bacterium]